MPPRLEPYEFDPFNPETYRSFRTVQSGDLTEQDSPMYGDASDQVMSDPRWQRKWGRRQRRSENIEDARFDPTAGQGGPEPVSFPNRRPDPLGASAGLADLERQAAFGQQLARFSFNERETAGLDAYDPLFLRIGGGAVAQAEKPAPPGWGLMANMPLPEQWRGWDASLRGLLESISPRAAAKEGGVSAEWAGPPEPSGVPGIALRPVAHDPFNIGTGTGAPAPGGPISDFLRGFGGGFSRAGDLGMESWESAMTGRYRPEGAVGINDAGEFVDAQGRSLPSTRRPNILPITRNAETGELEGAMPSILDVVNTLGSPAAATKGTVTLGAGLTRPARGGIGVEKSAPVFHSAVENAIEAAPLKSGTPEQWLGTIKNTKGVKQEELDWIGLDDWLKEQKGPVSKEQVAEFVRQNQVDLREVRKTDPAFDPDSIPDVELRERYNISRDEWEGMSAREQREFREEMFDDLASGGPLVTKYGQWQLAGGENYREVLLTMPRTESLKLAAMRDELEHIVSMNAAVETYKGESRTAAYDRLYKEFAAAGGTPRRPAGFKSGHWGEPNVLTHVRANDRVIDGKKTLFVEEIQSDWGQAGRRGGFASERQALLDATIAAERKSIARHQQYGAADPRSKEALAEFETVNAKLNEFEARGSPVPDMPFKKTWHELALKRMIREAAEKGYDQIAWTPGEVQAARYDLSKHVDSLNWFQNKDGTFNLSPQRHGAEMEMGRRTENLKPEELPEVIGKEAADKIIEASQKQLSPAETEQWNALRGRYVAGEKLPPDERKVYEALDERRKAGGDSGDYRYRARGTLENLDLKVGGEGMKGFYDKILVDAANKIGKPFGAKVRRGELGAVDVDPETATEAQIRAVMLAGGPDAIEKPQSVHILDITPKMREAAVGKGFPLFSGGFPLMPVDHDPFAEDR